jgi:hypothetical protein
LSLQVVLGFFILRTIIQLVLLPIQVLFELTCCCEYVDGRCLPSSHPYRFPWQREDWLQGVFNQNVRNRFFASDANVLPQDSNSPSLQPSDCSEPSAPPADLRPCDYVIDSYPMPRPTAASAWPGYGSSVGVDGHRVSITDSRMDPNFNSELLRKPLVADDGFKYDFFILFGTHKST